MKTAHERVTKALDQLTAGLFPFVERELKAVYRDGWLDAARGSFRADRTQGQPRGEVVRWDAHALLTVMWDQWNSVFRHKLSPTQRSLVNELREFRNRWAHQESFSFDDTYRILDSVQRLLTAVSADEVATVAQDKRQLLRDEIEAEANSTARQEALTNDRRLVVSVYSICCIAIVWQLFHSWGSSAWLVSAGVVLVFAYLILQRLTVTPPTSGPHECKRCSRIIYTETCPYCVIRPVEVADTHTATPTS